MSLQATSNTVRKSEISSEDTDLTQDERRQIVEFGIGFDGRYYRYREYRYDRLSDALNYAQLEIRKSGRQAVDVSHPWLEPHQPTEAELLLMERFAVTFDGKYYLYRGYRYDRCVDALNYAKLKMPDQGA